MKRRVLVVEDDLLSRELLCDWLGTEGFEVICVSDLTAGRAAFATNPPDAVLLDVRLGSEDGLELAQWIRSHPHFVRIPVIAVTAHAMLTERERILQAGCNAFLAKPIHFPDLRRELNRWLEGNRAAGD